MDVNSINSNINNLPSIPQHQLLEKTASNEKLQSVSNDSLNLTISKSFTFNKEELSNTLQNLNEGIAITKIAQNGLQKEQEFLKNIQNSLEENKNLDDKNQLKQLIQDNLNEFGKVAYETKFKNRQLLASNENEQLNSIRIETKDRYFDFNVLNTPVVSNELSNDINKNDLNDESFFNTFSQKVQTSLNHLEELSKQFNTNDLQMQDSAKKTISKQYELASLNQTFDNTPNFGKDSNDFTKNNLTVNMGYLAVSQANILQEQSVRLLS